MDSKEQEHEDSLLLEHIERCDDCRIHLAATVPDPVVTRDGLGDSQEKDLEGGNLSRSDLFLLLLCEGQPAFQPHMFQRDLPEDSDDLADDRQTEHKGETEKVLADAEPVSAVRRLISSRLYYRQVIRTLLNRELQAMNGWQSREDMEKGNAEIQPSIDWAEVHVRPEMMRRMLARAFGEHACVELERAEADIQRSVDCAEAQVPRDDGKLALLYGLRAGTWQDRGDLKRAEGEIQRSIDWAEAQVPRDEAKLVMWYAVRASIWQDHGDLDRAEADIQLSIDLGEAQIPREEGKLAIWFGLRANIWQDRGNLERAQADIQRSIDCAEAQVPRDEAKLVMWRNFRETICQEKQFDPAKMDLLWKVAMDSILTLDTCQLTKEKVLEELTLRDMARQKDVSLAIHRLQANLEFFRKIRPDIDHSKKDWLA
jgi:tetratricopeptide (TPR) repeat protein